MADIHENPLGTDGFEFVEFAAGDSTLLSDLFGKLGFTASARHKSKDITLYRQGDIVFLLNREKGGFAEEFFNLHGPCACAMGFRVKDADFAYGEATKRGAKAITSEDRPLKVPAIEGIGGSRLYLVDKYGDQDAWADEYMPIDIAPNPVASRLTYLDHLTHNVVRGNMDKWANFYQDIFNFREIRYFDIEGKLTGLVSKAMTSPCGKIRIPINESQDNKSQIAEYLEEYNGEGIQHIAFGTDNIYNSVDALTDAGIPFQDTIDTYFELIDERLPGHGEDVDALKKRKILIDGAPTEGQGILLQIFTQNVIGPIFFEIIQRKGNEGFGEGNFQALFESIELDQIKRGVLSAD